MGPELSPFWSIYPGTGEDWQSPPNAERPTLIRFPGEPHPCTECGRPTEFMDLCSEQWVCCRRCQGVFWDVFEAVAQGDACILHRTLDTQSPPRPQCPDVHIPPWAHR